MALFALILNLMLLPYFLWILATTLAAYAAGARRKLPSGFAPKSRFLIVIPAHDEEHGILGTIQSCQSLDYPRGLYETLVLADNCTDATAEVAREAGATVVERHNLSRKSKGFALEDLFGQLRQSGRFDTFDAMVVIDADTTADPRLLSLFAYRMESAGAGWIQALYMVSNPDVSWRTGLMAYAFCLINGTMLLGQSALGLGAAFRGNGMCFSTKGLGRVPWSSHGLAEDEEFTCALRLAGESIVFEPAAAVRSAMLPSGGKAASSQRRRWEFGKKEARKKTRALLLRAPGLGWTTKLLSWIELTIPTTVYVLILYAALMLLNVAVLVVDPEIARGVRAVLVGSSVLTTTALVLYALSPFLIFRLPWRVGLSLAYVPIYAFWKLATMLQGRPKEWVRADRTQTAAQPAAGTPDDRLPPPASEPHGG